MQAVSPIVAALLAWVALGEPITARAGVAMAVALLGVGLMVGGPGSGGLLGVGASFVMMLAFAVAIVITRHRRDISMVPAICLSQLLVVLVARAVLPAGDRRPARSASSSCSSASVRWASGSCSSRWARD